MADYRKFWLINSRAEKFEFTDNSKSNVFLNNPSGLGFRRRIDTEKVGNSKLVTTQEFDLVPIEGELCFHALGNGPKYEDYQRFVQFIKYKPLELHYQTPNVLDSFYCDVIITKLDKSEVSKDDSLLRCPITFERLTEWLSGSDFTITLDNQPVGDGKYYDLIRDYYYAGTNLSGASINNSGTDDVGFVIEIDGYVENPQFSLFQNGEMYGIAKINGTYDYVQIDSVERNEHIYLERNGSVISNPEQYQDYTIRNGLSYLTWLKMKVGESTFSFTCGNIDTFDGTVKVSFKNSYATV